MDQEQIIRAYDPLIMRRLAGFLKPYSAVAAVAVLALLLSTAAELFIPIVLQRTLDRDILISYRGVTRGREQELCSREPDLCTDAVEIEGVRYIAGFRLNRLHGADTRSLVAEGLLSAGEYFVFPLTGSAGEREVLSRRAGIIQAGSSHGVLSAAALSELPADERRILRQPYLDRIAAASLRLLGLLAAALVFGFLEMYLLASTGQNIMKDLRTRLFGHILNQSLGYLSRHPVGRLVTRTTNDVETVNELFTTVLSSLLRDIFLMAGIVVALFALNARLGLVGVLTLPPVILVTVIFRTRAREAYRKVRLQVSNVNSFLSEHISGMSIVQTFVREGASREEFGSRNRDLMKANLGEMYVMATFRPVVDFLSSLSLAAVLFAGASFFSGNLISLGVLIAFLDLIRRFYQPVMDISDKFTVMQSAMAGGERVLGLLDVKDGIPDTGKKELPVPVRGEIVFENVSFSYTGGEPVIRELSFRVNAGETVAVVGYTGAGKTTIANLLTRLWDVDSGRILVDGTDIREVPLASLRSAILPVQQDVFVFTGTIEENIGLGSAVPPEELKKAAEAVQADVFISRLPEGYATVLSEGGSNLSTGQRQLLAFARVIAHNPAVIIMDEATGNIDTETEKLIRKGIRGLIRGRTSLIIAHRLSTIRHADRILVLAEGRLVEEGRHEELLERKGLYWNLYRFQYAQGETGTA